jgi:hypothetical protein
MSPPGSASAEAEPMPHTPQNGWGLAGLVVAALATVAFPVCGWWIYHAVIGRPIPDSLLAVEIGVLVLVAVGVAIRFRSRAPSWIVFGLLFAAHANALRGGLMCLFVCLGFAWFGVAQQRDKVQQRVGLRFIANAAGWLFGLAVLETLFVGWMFALAPAAESLAALVWCQRRPPSDGPRRWRTIALGFAWGLTVFWLLLVIAIAAILLGDPHLTTPFSGSSTLH